LQGTGAWRQRDGISRGNWSKKEKEENLAPYRKAQKAAELKEKRARLPAKSPKKGKKRKAHLAPLEE